MINVVVMINLLIDLADDLELVSTVIDLKLVSSYPSHHIVESSPDVCPGLTVYCSLRLGCLIVSTQHRYPSNFPPDLITLHLCHIKPFHSAYERVDPPCIRTRRPPLHTSASSSAASFHHFQVLLHFFIYLYNHILHHFCVL